MEEYCIMQDCVDYIALKWSDFVSFQKLGPMSGLCEPRLHE